MILILTIPDAMMKAVAYTTASKLETLPAELISDIFKLANLSARINLSLTRKFMARVATEAKVLEVECDKMSDATALSFVEDSSVPVTTRLRHFALSSAYLALHDTHHRLQFDCRYCGCGMWYRRASSDGGSSLTRSDAPYTRHAKFELERHQSGMLTRGYVILIEAVVSTLIERARRQKQRGSFLTLKYQK